MVSKYIKKKIENISVRILNRTEQSIYLKTTEWKSHIRRCEIERKDHEVIYSIGKSWKKAFSCDCWHWVNKTVHDIENDRQPRYCVHVLSVLKYLGEKGFIPKEKVEYYLSGIVKL